jgi:hypothetical protein
MKSTKADIAKAKEYLTEMFPIGSNVHCILESVSASGMSRVIRVIAIRDSKEYGIYTTNVDHLVSTVLGLSRPKGKQGCRVNGCGMDMGFHLVSSLSYALYGEENSLTHKWL